jgi:hypothetical protein
MAFSSPDTFPITPSLPELVAHAALDDSPGAVVRVPYNWIASPPPAQNRSASTELSRRVFQSTGTQIDDVGDRVDRPSLFPQQLEASRFPPSELHPSIPHLAFSAGRTDIRLWPSFHVPTLCPPGKKWK